MVWTNTVDGDLNKRIFCLTDYINFYINAMTTVNDKEIFQLTSRDHSPIGRSLLQEKRVNRCISKTFQFVADHCVKYHTPFIKTDVNYGEPLKRRWPLLCEWKTVFFQIMSYWPWNTRITCKTWNNWKLKEGQKIKVLGNLICR